MRSRDGNCRRIFPLIRPSGTFSRKEVREKAFQVYRLLPPFLREKVPNRADEGTFAALEAKLLKWPGHRFAFTLFVGVIGLWLIAMFAVMRVAALPSTANGIMLVIFEPGTPADQAFAAITRAQAKPIRKTDFGFIWVVEGNAGKLKFEGALGSYRDLPISTEIAGCIAVVDVKLATAFGL